MSEKATSTISLRWRAVLFFSLGIAGCTADLLTKYWIFAWRGMPPQFGRNVYWIPGMEHYVGVETALNPGALFGMFAGQGTWFAVLSVAAAVGICVWLFRFGGAKDLWLTIALGLVMGGIFGNLHDRLGLWSPPGETIYRNEVRDWILLEWPGEERPYTWPNFNIADMLLVTGAIMLVLHAFIAKPPTSQADLDAGQIAEKEKLQSPRQI
jgi:signal peptidase II